MCADALRLELAAAQKRTDVLSALASFQWSLEWEPMRLVGDFTPVVPQVATTVL